MQITIPIPLFWVLIGGTIGFAFGLFVGLNMQPEKPSRKQAD